MSTRHSAPPTFDGMTTTLQDKKSRRLSNRMYTTANDQLPRLRDRQGEFAQLASASAQERADALSEIYMPVTPVAGRLLYSLVRATRPTTIVEFGYLLRHLGHPPSVRGARQRQRPRRHH